MTSFYRSLLAFGAERIAFYADHIGTGMNDAPPAVNALIVEAQEHLRMAEMTLGRAMELLDPATSTAEPVCAGERGAE